MFSAARVWKDRPKAPLCIWLIWVISSLCTHTHTHTHNTQKKQYKCLSKKCYKCFWWWYLHVESSHCYPGRLFSKQANWCCVFQILAVWFPLFIAEISVFKETIKLWVSVILLILCQYLWVLKMWFKIFLKSIFNQYGIDK